MDTLIHFIANLSFAVGFSAGGILGYLVRLFVEDRLARDRIKFGIRETQHNTSANAFSHAFDSAILSLTTIDCSDKPILDAQFPVHEKAMIAFLLDIPAKDQAGFKEVWEQYKKYKYERCGSHPALSYPSEQPDVKKQDREKALSHINALLAFAKQK